MQKNNDPKKKDIKQESAEHVGETKVELAQRIAEQSERIGQRYQAVGNAVMRILRWFSAWFDRILFNSRHSKLIAFALTVLIMLAFNTTTAVAPQQAKVFTANSVVTNYNKELYEVSGVDESVKITVIGDYADIAIAESQTDYQVVLDLSGLTEGTHQVKYKVQGFSPRVRTIVEPESAEVTIRVKEAKTLQLGYEFLNQDKLNAQYVLGQPEFSTSEVTVKGSKETLEKVGFVKALIDVSGQTTKFTVDATVVAYDQNGNRIENVDIIPNTVSATVDVTSPTKNVPIKPVFRGTIPNNKAVQSVSLSNQTITIYAPQDVLDGITDIPVTVDATNLTDDTKRIENIVLPTGVRSAGISTVTMDIKLGEGVKKTFDKVQIRFTNNPNGYRFDTKPEDVYTSIEVFGTKENIDKIDPANIRAYIDLRDVQPANNIESQIFVDPTTYPLIEMKSLKKSITYNLIQ